MITVSNLSKSYGGHLVIEVSNLELSDGIHWFKGANGSGKTTLLHLLLGLVKPQKGQISDRKSVV